MKEYSFLWFLEQNAANTTNEYWLRDLTENGDQKWTAAEGLAEIKAAAAWFEDKYGKDTSIALLSKNCAHWVLADIAIMSSGNVTVPMFTTMGPDLIEYLRDFPETKAVVLGESMNYPAVKHLLEGLDIITLPGFDLSGDSATAPIKWDDIQAEYAGKEPKGAQDTDKMATIVFTSGTTGKPKGVMQSQASLLIPSERCNVAFKCSTLFSYLPLSHIAERDLVEGTSVVQDGMITFSRGMDTLKEDLQATRPTFFFGPPRVWEQLQMGIMAQFGGAEGFNGALAAKGDGLKMAIKQGLGLDKCEYALSAAAPIAPALVHWYRDKLDLPLMEGFGQSEIMTAIVNFIDDNKVGSIGKAIEGVAVKLSPEDSEIVIRAPGQALGYYKNPEATAETFKKDGWVYTGDKGRIDEDGFYYITGRVKDSFKTIQGKFVSPNPIEKQFGEVKECPQLCLLGRGYHKTVMVAVVSEAVAADAFPALESKILAVVEQINDTVQHHERIGAVILSRDPWSIENQILTHTMKIKREAVEQRFGEIAQSLALKSAEERKILIEWH